ncbi:MAG: phosphoglucomutase/phosphomannomutase family protein [Bacteroidia bacterium]|jgi:phosphomannomutase|nr:phosphoglucomutase/phosphomannomutase family protein [Bacteroidia bacterium]
MYQIKFGTDGWRGIIAAEFNVDNVRRVAQGTALYIKSHHPDNLNVVLGHDCRFAGELFAETVAQVMCANGIKVKLAKGFVSTPMISLGAVKFGASLGIIITASHNPPAYSGYKLKAHYGGPSSPAVIDMVEQLIPNTIEEKLNSIEELISNGMITYVNLEDLYIDEVKQKFDLKAIKNSGLKFGYDAMYGAGQNVMKKLFPEAFLLHCEYNPSFYNQAPEPIHKNLAEFSAAIKERGDIDCGLVTDGDADRIGLYNKKGEFVDSHHIILLLIHYMYKYKGMNGKVITTFSATSKITDLAKAYGLDIEITKIGFKYICEKMVTENVLVGGEESGGIAIKGFIPERDGIWIGLTLWEFMAKTGKSLDELINEVYDVVGGFAMGRIDLHITEDIKQNVLAKCKSGSYRTFGSYTIEKVEDLDGFKFHLGNNEWVMIRASGTEPVLRVYSESSTIHKAEAILTACKNEILN